MSNLMVSLTNEGEQSMEGKGITILNEGREELSWHRVDKEGNAVDDPQVMEGGSSASTTLYAGQRLIVEELQADAQAEGGDEPKARSSRRAKG